MQERHDYNSDSYPEGDIFAQVEFILKNNKPEGSTYDNAEQAPVLEECDISRLENVRRSLQETYEAKYPDLAHPYLDFSHARAVLSLEGEALELQQLEELAMMSDEYGRMVRVHSQGGSNIMRRLNSSGNSEIQYLAQQRIFFLKVFELSREKVVEEIDYSIVQGVIVEDPPRLSLWERVRNLSSERQKVYFKSVVAERIGNTEYALPSDLSGARSRGGELAEYLLLQQVQKNTAARVNEEIQRGI